MYVRVKAAVMLVRLANKSKHDRTIFIQCACFLPHFYGIEIS